MDTSTILSAIALLVAGFGYYENRRGNNIQLRQAVALEKSNQISLGQRAESMASVSSSPSIKPNQWPAFALLVLLLMNIGVTAFSYYDRHYAARSTDEGWVSPHNRKVQFVDFFPSWPLDLERNLLAVAKPCLLKISAVKEQMKLRSVLAQIANENSACTVVDDLADQDQSPSEFRDLDAMPIPQQAGLSIHWNKDAQPRGESIAGWFYGLGFIVNRGDKLPPNSKPTEIWIDIGPGSPWQ
ncbi:hypothetical protein [Candidatus Binatus sp.]|uniref:hypothetical protein n=1 Tax=Candidatus Binatus sp. TaxID=2811406 RepID=UPI003C79532F